MKLQKFLFLFFLSLSISMAAPLFDQTGNLLQNGSMEAGNYNPVTATAGASAANNWYQWSNSCLAPTTEMITDSEMYSLYGVGVWEGSSALRVKTYGSSDGPYTVTSFGNTAWASAGTYNVPYTFSGWVYVISGGMYLAAGSNSYSYTNSYNTKVGQWEFISVTRTANCVDELLIYSTSASEFIVDSLWLNAGSTSLHPQQFVPEISSLGLVLLGLLLCFYKKR